MHARTAIVVLTALITSACAGPPVLQATDGSPPAPVAVVASPAVSVGWRPSGTGGELRVAYERLDAAFTALAAARPTEGNGGAKEGKRKATPALPKAPGGSHRGWGTARQCVVMVENGGSYDRSSNPGHFGRYQFGRPTWVAFGGDPATWGVAAPAEQDAVFDTAWSQGPAVQTQTWLRWDGCGPPDGS